MEMSKEYNFRNLLDEIMEKEDNNEEYCLTVCIEKYNKNPQLYQQIINYLLDKDVNINCKGPYGWSPLIHALHSNNLELVNFLINSGANIHERTLQCTYDIDILTYLLNLGADPNQMSDGDCPVLFDWLFCAMSDDIDIKIEIPKLFELIGLFIQYGGNINIKSNETGETCLFQVCQYNHCEICKFLLDHGADPNIQDNDGNTPLMCCRSYEMCKLLLDYKASAKNRNHKGRTTIVSFIENVDIDDKEIIPMCILMIWAGCDINQYYTNNYVSLFTFIIDNNLNRSSKSRNPFNEDLFKLFHSLPYVIQNRSPDLFATGNNLKELLLVQYKYKKYENDLIKIYFDQKKDFCKMRYNLVFQFIPQNSQHIKLKPNNLGCQIIKINNDLRNNSEKEIYDELLKKKSKVIDYLNIKNINELRTNIKQYIDTLYL
ncbi:ankyrin repeat protein [Klosneuvirus KNV1]|uniref:Ankyrin repeat protein n=1 Tax=Klosneuvirus KNV1 TaxID=1977640 RepID=A0A1V0SHS7_9VIRU|nr:ankyrin repeat protein [Klosneuvirus KNV1]